MYLTVIVPVYNEQASLAGTLLSLLMALPKNINSQVIAVDDGSTDHTPDILKQHSGRITILHHPQNLGKGAAIRSGLDSAKGQLTLIQDADQEYFPHDIPHLLTAFRTYRTPIYGSRFLTSNPPGYFFHHLGTPFVTRLFNLRFGSRLTDVFTGYKLIATDLFKSLPLSASSFDIELEITSQLLRRKISITEIPISYSPRSFSQGKKLGVSAMVHCLISLPRILS